MRLIDLANAQTTATWTSSGPSTSQDRAATANVVTEAALIRSSLDPSGQLRCHHLPAVKPAPIDNESPVTDRMEGSLLLT